VSIHRCPVHPVAGDTSNVQASLAGVISLSIPHGPIFVVCIGAHPDDIEIGCGGTLLALARRSDVTVASLVLTGTAQRAEEALSAATAFAPGSTVEVDSFSDGRLPDGWGAVKDAMHRFRDAHPTPDIVFAPRRGDRHQDHSLLGEMVPTVWRDALVLHYEIPKWDGDPAAPNVYVGLSPDDARRKVALLNEHFPSQGVHDWWTDDLFLGLMRVRGMECRTRYAEAFEVHKASLAI
jgi:LmbE family N-acetylglucosaminyl deacetylase